MCQKMEEGGLSMINVDDLQKSFLLSGGGGGGGGGN